MRKLPLIMGSDPIIAPFYGNFDAEVRINDDHMSSPMAIVQKVIITGYNIYVERRPGGHDKAMAFLCVTPSHFL